MGLKELNDKKSSMADSFNLPLPSRASVKVKNNKEIKGKSLWLLFFKRRKKGKLNAAIIAADSFAEAKIHLSYKMNKKQHQVVDCVFLNDFNKTGQVLAMFTHLNQELVDFTENDNLYCDNFKDEEEDK